MADDDSAQSDSVPAEPVVPPDSAEATTGRPEAAQEASASAPEQPETQTAQISVNEPLPSPSEPIPAPAQTSGSSSAAISRDRLVVARATIQTRKHKKLEKILAEIEKHGKITNDQVEKLLHVSDATATRYLSELEKEGKIKQVGKTGKAVTYTKA